MALNTIFLYLRETLGLLFVVAAVSKVWDRRAFQQALNGFGVVPERLAQIVATTIVSLELMGGALLVAATCEWLGAVLLAMLLSAFNVALILNLLRGRRNLDCRCFGRRTVRIGWGHVVQNTVFLGITAMIGIAARGNVFPAPRDPASLWLTILAAAYTAVFFFAAQEMANVRAGLVRMLSRINSE